VSVLDRDLLAERAMAVRRHLARVAERLPAQVSELQPATDAADAVILHRWQAVQVVIDFAVSACLHWDLGTPTCYAEAFRRLAAAGIIDEEMAARLARAAGFRNIIAHAYDQLDMKRVFRAASEGPRDLEALSRRCMPASETFLSALHARL
jgi:uncharacterized protein YutE (UPF0331/DUF86 family)